MSFTRTSIFSTEIEKSNNIIFYIVTNNFNKVKELINSKNVNNIIDKTNKYTFYKGPSKIMVIIILN
jgi:hypothetical protein